MLCKNNFFANNLSFNLILLIIKCGRKLGFNEIISLFITQSMRINLPLPCGTRLERRLTFLVAIGCLQF